MIQWTNNDNSDVNQSKNPLYNPDNHSKLSISQQINSQIDSQKLFEKDGEEEKLKPNERSMEKDDCNNQG